MELASRGAGYVAPNPLVGCVIVSATGRLAGQGYHQKYGQAHAEMNALESITDRSELTDATVYVTLEPCMHQGKTPPCAKELAKWPIKRVVVAMEDPTEKVGGKGIRHLRNSGIQVDVGLMEEEAREMNRFFAYFQALGRPYVTLKIAQTADGYIAAPDGSTNWITGKESRTLVHKWRSEYDAVMIGRNTADMDNPRLTVRHVKGRQPYRIVLDGPYELSEELNLFNDQYEEKTIRITYSKDKAGDQADPMLNLLKPNYFRGETIIVPSVDGHIDLDDAIRKLGTRNITSLLVEAGPELASALLKNDLVEELQLFIAPKLLGAGTRSLGSIGIDRLQDALSFRSYRWQQVGDDMLLTGFM